MVFFSGTDWDTLLESTNDYDFFLSIIVNNKGEIIGKVAKKGISTVVTNNVYRINSRGEIIGTPKIEEKEGIFVYDCDIIFKSDIHKDIVLIDKANLEKEALKVTEYKAFPNYYKEYHKPSNNTQHILRFGDDWDVDQDIDAFGNKLLTADAKPMSLKDKVIHFIKSCMLLDVEDSLEYSYQKAKEEFTEMHPDKEDIKDYKECLMMEVDDFFYQIFGVCDIKEIAEIEKLFRLNIQDGVVERIIEKTFNIYMDSYKKQLK